MALQSSSRSFPSEGRPLRFRIGTARRVFRCGRRTASFVQRQTQCLIDVLLGRIRPAHLIGFTSPAPRRETGLPEAATHRHVFRAACESSLM